MRGGFAFSQVPVADIQRSAFNRSHGHKTTFNSGKLIPVYVDEVLPGDTFSLRMHAFARMNTPIVPVMDNLYMDVFFFYVPLRLLWTNFKKMMGEQVNPGDSIDYGVPQLTGTVTEGSLGDYFGLPIGVANLGTPTICNVSSLWHRAYFKIWNEWFRDENLQNSDATGSEMGDGPNAWATAMPLSRGKRHDYFTSCLPWPQKGTAASLPLGTSAPVKSSGLNPTVSAQGQSTPNASLKVGGSGTNPAYPEWNATGSTLHTSNFIWGNESGLYTDLTGATAATINSLRQAFQIQALLEKDARGGTRYTEIVRSHFGVVSPDQRLQRPEYLGGGSIRVNINPVTQTSGTSISGQTTPQGNMSAYGVAAGGGIGFVKSFTEHGVLMGLVEVRADLSYYQGVPRMFQRRTRYDFYWPAFAHLGEQAVLNGEIYSQGTTADQAVFGYQERWAEYRYCPSKITGKFRGTATGPLDIWHLAQKFTSLPTLGDTFIQDAPPVSRVIAVPAQPEFNFDSYFSLKCVRPLPTYSVPGLGTRF